MGQLDRLELHNFKSYGGDVTVGPFLRFTAVIGTNGTGKSNLMDAISFVLGVKTSQLRGSQLRDLVYRNMEDPDDDPSSRKAHVRLVYKTDSENAERSEIDFMRGVNLSGGSEYRFCGRTVSLERYNEELAKIGILVKSRNFLVFQNEIESVSSQSGKDLTNMLEHVSRSIELRGQYDEAWTEKEAAEEDVTNFWKKRKELNAEKRRFREQEEEVARFRRVENKISDTKVEKSLFELFHVDEDLRNVRCEVKISKDELEIHTRELGKKERTLTAEKRRASGLDKELNKLTRRKDRLAEEIEKLRPTEAKYRTEQTAINRRKKGDEKRLETLKEEHSKGSAEISSTENAVKECESAIADIDREIVEVETASVSAESMSEYKELKETVSSRTSALQQELLVASRNADGAQKHRSSLKDRETELRDRSKTLSNSIQVYRTRAEKLSRQIKEASDKVSDLRRQQSRLKHVHAERTRVRSQLEKKLNDIVQELRDANANLHESARERAMNAAVEEMQQLYPGVHGRISDLCQPVQARYKEAIAVVFGKLMDAIVVDTVKTGDECIRYLKDKKVGSATFLPLESVRPQPIDESLRRLGGTSRLVVDVLRYENRIGRAVAYAAGNALVCDTLDEARNIGYERGRRLKICALDGTLISKTGFMTGGASRGDADRASKWNRAEIEAQQRKRESVEQELQALGSGSDERRNAASLAEEIDALSRKKSILELDAKEAVDREKLSSEDSTKIEQELQELVPQLERAEGECKTTDKNVQRIQAQLESLENDLFGDFARRHNVQSVKQFEEQFVQRSRSLRLKKTELETKLHNISTSLKHLRKQQHPSDINRLTQQIEARNAKLTEIDDNLESLQQNRSELENRLSSVNEQIETTSSERKSAAKLIADKRQEFRKENESVTDSKRVLTENKLKLNRLEGQRLKLLTAAKVEQVELPTRTTDSDDEDDENNPGENVDQEGDVIMSTDQGDETPVTDSEEAKTLLAMRIDYSSLSRRQRAAATTNKQKEVLDGIAETIHNLEQDLSNLAPNLKATEQMADTAEKISEINRQADDANERSRVALAAYDSVKKERQRRFNACLEHVSSKISEIYSELTKSNAYPQGGSAFLTPDQQDEVYLGGITYNAMPPTKRFRDMNQLSGGERSVAALALLFAIHDFQPSPFFVLDEVDAALDKLNVERVATYLNSRAPQLQTVVISLKEHLYEKAQGLVGIYRDASLHCSRLLTLDLRAYPEETESQSAQPVQSAAQTQSS